MARILTVVGDTKVCGSQDGLVPVCTSSRVAVIAVISVVDDGDDNDDK